MATTYTKKFKEFIQEWNPEGDDYIVGYRSLDDSEIRIPLLAVDNSITSNKYIRKDIDDYANGLIRFNKGFTVSSNVMSTIYLQGLNGWMGTQKGDFEMNSLTLREFLEVPELRKNKITVMGNQFWFTDSAMVKVANATGSGNYDIYFKLEEDEYAPFELNDILKGIYHYSSGFWTVYLKVYELILNPDTLGEIGIRVHAMNNRDPRQSMLLARINNSEDKERQGSIFADGLRRYIRVLYGYDELDPTSEGSIKSLKVQMGDLSTITNHPIFGDLEGYGLYADNVYLTGKLIVKNDPNQPGQELGVYRGVWNAKSNYYKYDQVTYNGSLYTSKQIDNVGHVPTGTPDDIWWELTVSKGNDGTSGEANINIELTNDNHTIPTDSEGKNPSYGGAYSTAFVYQGTKDVTDVYTIIATLEAPIPASKLQFVQNDNTVTITYIADDIDGANIKFTATAKGYPTVSKMWGISKVKSGKPGSNATSYWLVTDTPVIKKHVYNVSGSEVIRYEPSPFVIRAFAQTGTDPIRQYSGYIKLTYGSQIQVVAGSTYQFTPEADVSNYTIELFQEVGLKTLLDKEIVTVVEDGKVPNWQTYIFKPSDSIPSTPTYINPPKVFPTPEGWYDYPNDSTSIWWMSTASINGVTNVVYDWSKPVKVTGEDGSDGVDGTWTDFKFAKNTTINTAPSIVVTDRNPAGWTDTTPTIGSNEYLWMTRAVISPDNTLKTNWSNPVRISGEKGDTGPIGPQGPQGLHGVDGLQGPSIAFGGNWSASTQYYGYNTTQTGVYYGGKYYYTKTVSPDLSPIAIPSGDANNPASATGKIYWNEFVGQFSNIATGLLLAERIATSELTANKLFIVDRQESTGNIIASDGTIITKEEEKNLNPSQIIGRLTTGWYMDQGVIRSIAVNTDKTPKLTLSKDGKITATGVTITGTVHFENGTIGSMQVFNDSTWTSTVNGPFPASTGFYYLRKNNGVTVTPQGHIIGKDYFLTGDSTQGPSVFIGDVYIPGGSVPGTDDSTLTSFLKLFNSLFERVLIGSQYMIKAKLPLFSIGELIAYGSDGMEVPSLWEGIPVDKVTINMINGKLTVIGGTGGIKGIVLPAMTAEDALVGASLNSSGDTITFTKGTFATKSYVTWANITSKPTTFTPSAHNQDLSTITDLNASWDALLKVAPPAQITRWAAWSEITGKPSVIIEGDARLTNARSASDVSAWAKAASKPTYSWSEISSKPTTFTPSSHSHTISDISNINSASVNYANSAGSATYASYLPTAYIGGQQHNPQTYFGAGMGVRVAMTGTWSVWSDTLWINGYSGGDFLYMCALHFLRNGTPRMAISTQTSTGTSYGSIYEVLTDYNYNSRVPTLTGGGASGTWAINITGISKGLESIATTTGNNMTDRPWQLWYWNQWVGDTAGIPATYMCGLNMRAQDTNYGMQLGTTAFNDVLYFRKYKGGAYRPWQIIATTDSNVYSATKLQTARTIFGKSFDGTNNVNGGAKFVNICIETNNSVDDSSMGSEINNYNDKLYLQHSTTNNCIICTGGGNVGIGTTSPNYKLEVAGDIKSQAWLRTIGAQGWYNDTYGGGWHMTDATFLRAYNNKAIFTDSREYYSFNTNGGYHSIANYQIGGVAWTDVSSNTSHVFIVSNTATPIQCYNRILGWADVMSGVGYQTSYSIASLRNGYQFGAMAFSITNNDVGTNGHQLILYANGTMDWTGNIVANMEITAYSDVRLKSNISNLSFRGKLTPKTYIKDGKQSIGFIAQEVQQLYPELILIGSDENHYLSLNYGNISAVLAAQLNLVDDEVEVLKRKVQQLEQEIIILKKQHYGS